MSQPERILVVDDEANIRLTLSAMLQRSGYEVVSADGGEEAVQHLERQQFELMLVDLKMPGMDGMQVVAAARQRQPDISIIVLTGHGSLDTAIESIHQHVFDYLLKTTEPTQVIERIRAALAARYQELKQRNLLNVVTNAVMELRGHGDGSGVDGAPGSTERTITIGALQLDTWRQVATLGGKGLTLTPTEFRVLLCMAEHSGAMVSYAQLVRCAQGYEASELEAGELIKPHIHHLRQKLEPDPSAPRYILNVRGKGYLLSAYPAE